MGFLSVLSQAQRLVAEALKPGDIAIDATAGGGVDTLFLAQAAGRSGKVYAFDVQQAALDRTQARLLAAGGDGEMRDAAGRVGEVLDGEVRGGEVRGGEVQGGEVRGGEYMVRMRESLADADALRGHEARATVDELSKGNVGDLLRHEYEGGAAGAAVVAVSRPGTHRSRDRTVGIANVRLLLAGHETMRQHIPPREHGRIAAAMFNLGYLPGADQQLITLTNTTLTALQDALALLRSGGVLTIVVYPGHPGGDEEAAAVERWASALPPETGQSIVYRFTQKPHAPYLIAVSKR